LKIAWDESRGSDQILRPLQLPVQILKGFAEIILLFGNKSGVSEPVDRADKAAHHRVSPLDRPTSPDSIASPSVSKLRASGVLIRDPCSFRNLRGRCTRALLKALDRAEVLLQG
jgi:hypothetical protein